MLEEWLIRCSPSTAGQNYDILLSWTLCGDGSSGGGGIGPEVVVEHANPLSHAGQAVCIVLVEPTDVIH